LITLESTEAKTKKDMLKARISCQGSGATTKHRRAAGNQQCDGSLRAHGRESLDARSSCSGSSELAGADLESQFAMLESGGVDDELAALKAQMLPPGTSQNQPSWLHNQSGGPNQSSS